MPIFNIMNSKLQLIKETQFQLEKEMQKLTEDNLNTIFGLTYVCSQFELNGLRIDTLAFNEETTSFVIIEYKNDRNSSVIDQGFAYLGLLLNNKADFVLKFNDVLKKTLNKDDIDWTQSRVLFISPSFTTYQQKALHFKDMPFELWEIKKYENDSVLFNQIRSPESSESITTVTDIKDVESVTRQVKVYTEEDHISYAKDEVKELYFKLKNLILNLGDSIEIKPVKFYIAFKSKSNFVDVEIQKNQLKIFLNLAKGTLDDPKKVARDVSEIGHWGNGDYQIIISNSNELEYISSLTRGVSPFLGLVPRSSAAV